MEILAKIGIARPAKLAASAGLRRIDRHQRPRPQWLPQPIAGVVAQGFDGAGELMSGNQWAGKLGVADSRVAVGVQITAADSYRPDPQQYLARGGRSRRRHFLDAKIFRTMEPCSEHNSPSKSLRVFTNKTGRAGQEERRKENSGKEDGA
jgi:hypothetical protein